MNLTARTMVLTTLALAMGSASCDFLGPEGPEEDEILDGPIATLTPNQVRQHVLGDIEFGRKFSSSEGLGPIFVAASCDQCHVGDGKGHPTFALTRFGRLGANGFDALPALGGPQLQNRAVAGHSPEVLPVEATGVSRFLPPAVSGLGYLDEVDDSTLMRLADPNDTDGDGVSGRLQLIEATGVALASLELEGAGAVSDGTHGTRVGGRFIGRFGKKALTVNLLHQTVGAYHQDMGITSDLIPEDLYNPAEGRRTSDVAPDPEVTSSTVAQVAFYLKTLRAPDRREPDHPDVVAGELLFDDIGCADCHLPTLRTGDSNIASLHRVDFHPYTDLLLHDMGPELDDGYTEGSATTAEWRTPPLWGIGIQQRFQGGQAFFLHDGRARTLAEAIEFHGGEGAGSRAAFRALPPEAQEQLLRFLRSL